MIPLSSASLSLAVLQDNPPLGPLEDLRDQWLRLKMKILGPGYVLDPERGLRRLLIMFGNYLTEGSPWEPYSLGYELTRPAEGWVRAALTMSGPEEDLPDPRPHLEARLRDARSWLPGARVGIHEAEGGELWGRYGTVLITRGWASLTEERGAREWGVSFLMREELLAPQFGLWPHSDPPPDADGFLADGAWSLREGMLLLGRTHVNWPWGPSAPPFGHRPHRLDCLNLRPSEGGLMREALSHPRTTLLEALTLTKRMGAVEGPPLKAAPHHWNMRFLEEARCWPMFKDGYGPGRWAALVEAALPPLWHALLAQGLGGRWDCSIDNCNNEPAYQVISPDGEALLNLKPDFYAGKLTVSWQRRERRAWAPRYRPQEVAVFYGGPTVSLPWFELDLDPPALAEAARPLVTWLTEQMTLQVRDFLASRSERP